MQTLPGIFWGIFTPVPCGNEQPLPSSIRGFLGVGMLRDFPWIFAGKSWGFWDPRGKPGKLYLPLPPWGSFLAHPGALPGPGSFVGVSRGSFGQNSTFLLEKKKKNPWRLGNVPMDLGKRRWEKLETSPPPAFPGAEGQQSHFSTWEESWEELQIRPGMGFSRRTP